MNAILQSQLDRVETALNTLLDSITTYNPSVPAALDLLSADTDLTHGLNQLCAHQQNHTRILSLRATASTLDSHLTSTLALLASTRTDLLSTPATSTPASHLPVPYPSLLSYAKHISKFTAPPPLTQPQAPPFPPPSITNPEAQSPPPKSANGADTPAADAATAGEQPREQAAGLGVAALQPGEVQWLEPGTQGAWGPWPSEEVIRRGALARIQVLVEQGVDPESVGAEEAGGEEKAEEGEEAGDGEAGRQGGGGERRDGKVREGGRERRGEKPRVFGGLDLYDPDAEA